MNSYKKTPCLLRFEPVTSQVTCGHTHSLALDDKGAAYTWGNGNYGKLGHKVRVWVLPSGVRVVKHSLDC